MPQNSVTAIISTSDANGLAIILSLSPPIGQSVNAIDFFRCNQYNQNHIT